jgi:hypothetical protein
MTADAGDGLAVWCRDVRKHFGAGETRIDALRGVDFTARYGELTFSWSDRAAAARPP